MGYFIANLCPAFEKEAHSHATCEGIMSRAKTTVLVLGLFFLALPSVGMAQTQLTGALFGTLTAENSPYFITGGGADTVYVPPYYTLTIEPGVELHFGENNRLWVAGTLLVEGEPGDSVLFTAHGGGYPGAWKGIVLFSMGASGSVISRARIEYGEINLVFYETTATIANSSLYGASSNSIRIYAGSPTIQNCRISLTTIGQGGNAVAGQGGSARVWDCTLNGRSGGESGIKFFDGATPSIRNNTLGDFSNSGIELIDCYDAVVHGNVIANVDFRGIELQDNVIADISRNVVSGSRGPGIYVDGCTSITLLQNTIYNTGAGQVADKDGIFVGLETYSTLFCGNIVMGSTGYGVRSNSDAVDVHYSCFYNNASGSYGGQAYEGVGNLFENPQVHLGLQYHDPEFLRLQAGSPCIDACVCGEDDPDGTTGDIGARFYNQNEPPVIDSRIPASPNLVDLTWGEEVQFSVNAHDPEGEELAYHWYFKGELVSESSSADIRIFDDVGDTIRVEVDDGYYEGITTVTWIVGSVAAPEPVDEGVPDRFDVTRVYPNPFNATVQVHIAVPQTGDIRLHICDLLGRTVTSQSRRVQPGVHPFVFQGHTWASGVYFLRAECNGESRLQKLVLVR